LPPVSPPLVVLSPEVPPLPVVVLLAPPLVEPVCVEPVCVPPVPLVLLSFALHPDAVPMHSAAMKQSGT